MLRYHLCEVVVFCLFVFCGFSCFAWSAEKLDIGKIIVTPSKIRQVYKDTTANVSVITAKEIAEAGFIETAQVLEAFASIEVLDQGTFGSVRSVRLRGTSSQQVLTLIDGRPANTPRDGLTDFSQIPLHMIERIEVLRGPAAAIYGANAVGGVINVITKKGDEDMYTSIETGYGDYATRIATVSHGWKTHDLDYYVSAGHIRSNGHRAHSGYETYNAQVNMGYNFDELNRIGVSAGHIKSELEVPGLITWIDLDDQQNSWKDFVDCTYTGNLWEGSDLLFKVYQNTDRYEFIETETPLAKDTHRTKSFGIDTQIAQTFFEKVRATLGFNGVKNKLRSSTSGNRTYDVKAFYGETETEFFNDLIVKAGVRYDDYSTFGGKTSPSVSFSYWWRDTIKLHGLWAKSFRAPTFNDLYWPEEDWGAWGGVRGNENLKPETAESFEIGFGTYLFDILETDVTYFHNIFKDLIEWQMDETLWWEPSNVSAAMVEGVETTTRALLFNQIHAEFSHTYLRSENRTTGKDLTYRPKHLWKLGATWDSSAENGLLKGLDINAQLRYRTGRFTDVDNARTLGDDFTTDCTVRKQITEHITTSFSIFNLFDREYEDEENYPMPGRTLLGTVKMEW